MTFFAICAWIMLFTGACTWMCLPAGIVGGFLVIMLSGGNPKDNPAGVVIGFLVGIVTWLFGVYWFLSNISLSFGGQFVNG